jgi:hypothetical protein
MSSIRHVRKTPSSALSWSSRRTSRPGRHEPVGRRPGLAHHRPSRTRSRDLGTRCLPACCAGRHRRSPGGPWILIRLIEAWNRPAAGRPAQRYLVRTVSRLSRDGPPPVACSSCRRDLAVQWELSLHWELNWELKNVSRTRSTPLIRAIRKIVYDLEPRYEIEPQTCSLPWGFDRPPGQGFR